MSDVVEVSGTSTVVMVAGSGVTVEQSVVESVVEMAVRGPQGATGPEGLQGDVGPQGETGATGPGVPAGGDVGQLLRKSGVADFAAAWASLGASINVQEWTEPGEDTWVKPDGATMVLGCVVGAGSGGSSGAVAAAGAVAYGGGGSSGAGMLLFCVPANQLPDTVPIVVGTGGAGGASASSGQNSGAYGEASSFGGRFAYYGMAPTGRAANTITLGSKILNGLDGSIPSAAGGSSATTSAGWGESVTKQTPLGGGSGGPVTSANASRSGGQGGYYSGAGEVTVPASGGAIGLPGEDGADNPIGGGGGGGGGGSNASGNGGDGGHGGWPGGGGGGGGGCRTGYQSGAGGNGGHGYVRIVTFCNPEVS